MCLSHRKGKEMIRLTPNRSQPSQPTVATVVVVVPTRNLVQDITGFIRQINGGLVVNTNVREEILDNGLETFLDDIINPVGCVSGGGRKYGLLLGHGRCDVRSRRR